MIASIEVLLSKASLVEVEILVEKVFKTRKSKYSYKLSFFVFISVSIFFFENSCNCLWVFTILTL